MVSIDLRFAAPSAVTPPAAAAGGAPPPPSAGGVKAGDIIAKNMLRPRDEPIAKTINRMRMLCAPPRPKAGVGKRLQADAILAQCPPAVLLDDEGQPIDDSLSNSEAWSRADSLVIGDAKIRVKYNIPTITGITAPSVAYAGVPVACTGINVLFSDGRPLVMEWLLGNKAGDGIDQSVPPLLTGLPVITPKKEWAGRKLHFRCRVDVADALWTETETPPVSTDAKGFGPFPRSEHLRPKPESSIRVVSYNVLHESYANSKTSLANVYPFCTKDVLAMSYRRSRIVQELQSYDADIICLQECGRDVFNRYYAEVFRHWSYRGNLAVKTGQTKEGCCVMYRESRFEAVGKPVVLPLHWRTIKKKYPAIAAEITAEHPHLKVGFKRVPSVGIITSLRDKLTGRHVVVSNTHLYYHPHGCHIRALQAWMLFAAAQEVAAELGPDTELICPGDYNFTRPTGGYRLATTGEVLPDDTCWLKGLRHYWGMDKGLGAVTAQAEVDDDSFEDDDDVEAVLVDDDEDAAVAGGGDDGEQTAAAAAAVAGAVTEAKDDDSNFAALLQSPPTKAYMPMLSLPHGPLRDTHPTDEQMKYSNYAIGFKEVIDHIFTSHGLRCDWSLPQPTEEQLSADVAIPSHVFPSDHIALVVDLEYDRPAAAAAQSDTA